MIFFAVFRLPIRHFRRKSTLKNFNDLQHSWPKFRLLKSRVHFDKKNQNYKFWTIHTKDKTWFKLFLPTNNEYKLLFFSNSTVISISKRISRLLVYWKTSHGDKSFPAVGKTASLFKMGSFAKTCQRKLTTTSNTVRKQ